MNMDNTYIAGQRRHADKANVKECEAVFTNCNQQNLIIVPLMQPEEMSAILLKLGYIT